MIFKFLYFLEGFDKVMKRLKEKKMDEEKENDGYMLIFIVKNHSKKQ